MMQPLPPLSSYDYENLRASIQQHGILSPIELDKNGEILDGHHRLKICSELSISDYPTVIKSFNNELEKQAYIYMVNLARRQLSAEQKKEIRKEQQKLAVELKKLDKTQAEIAGILGISQPTITAWLGEKTSIISADNACNICTDNTSLDLRYKIDQKEKEAILTELDAGKTQRQVAADFGITQQRVGQIYQKAEKHRQKEEARAAEPKVEDDNILVGDMRILGQDVPDNSIDLIFTDPPYGKEHVTDYEDLVLFASRTLKPGASLLCYVGQSVLPDVLAVMTPCLNYWWTIAIQHTGPKQRFEGKGIFIEWKPILWFVKGSRRDLKFMADFVKSKPDKSHHEWGQGIEEALYYIEHLTSPGELICDPFLGGGTTCAAAKLLKRRYLGFEKDPQTAEEAKKRIANEMS